MSRKYRIGIVGCGVAGAASALFLARDGHDVTIVEQAPVLGAAGAGILLQKSGQTILQHLGLRQQVLQHAAPLVELYARQFSGSTLIRTRYADYGPECCAYGVHRGMLFSALHAELGKLGVPVATGCVSVAREIDSQGVWVRDSCQSRHGPFDFLLVANGSRSRMREACGMRAHSWKYAHGTLWFIAPLKVPGRLLQVVRGNRQLFGLMPMGDGLCTMYWGLPERDYPALHKRGLMALKQEILSFAPESEPVLELITEMQQLHYTSYRHVWMPRWFDRTTLFLGDAAHSMSPHLGQGMNLALVDAYRFSGCLRESSTPHAAFYAFRHKQRAYLRYYALLTFALSPFFQSDWPILAWGRDLALPLLPKIPYVKRQMLMTVTGMKSDFFGGELQL